MKEKESIQEVAGKSATKEMASVASDAPEISPVKSNGGQERKLPIVRSQYSTMPKVRLATSGVAITQQHFRDEVNVNNIIAKYLKTGEIMVNTQKPQFGFASDKSFTESMFEVATAREAFEENKDNIRDQYATVEELYDAMQAEKAEKEPEVKVEQPPVSAPSEASPELEKAPTSS